MPERTRSGRRASRLETAAGRLTAAERSSLDAIFERLLQSALDDLGTGPSPLEVELWASQLWSIWQRGYLVDNDPVAVLAGGLIGYASEHPGHAAVMVLEALAAVAPEPYRDQAAEAARALSSSGAAQPAWAGQVGKSEPTEAWLISDPIDDDGVSVVVGFDGHAGADTVAIYVDHNLGGMAQDAFVIPVSVGKFMDRLRARGERRAHRPLDLAEAAARWRAALEVTDLTVGPLVDDELHVLRALLLSRLAKMPTRGKVPTPPKVDDQARAALVRSFLSSDDASQLAGSHPQGQETVEHIAWQLARFSLDYVVGTPLRFSPDMVQRFCLDWAPRKLALRDEAFSLVSEVLSSWIRFVGRRRGIPPSAMQEAVQAVPQFTPEMIRLSRDPGTWGPAKTIALALQDRGIDLTNAATVEELVDQAKPGLDLSATAPDGTSGRRHGRAYLRQIV
ncbi:MAG TPA: hypothetical protein VK425_03945 [Acidimicrobiales bacterium]|nr:hypothetical protein [Acidimicrobiales bacterium]